MQILYTAFGTLVGLALLAALGLGAYWGLAWLVGLVAGLDPRVAMVAGLLSALALLVAMIVAGGGHQAARQVRAWAVTAERARVYALFLDCWERLIQGQPDPSGEDAGVTAETLRTLDLRLTLYGSAGVLKAHHALRERLATGRLDGPEARMTLVTALIEIRQEIGSDSKGLTPAELTCGLFPDWDAPNPSPVPEPAVDPVTPAAPHRQPVR